jgi:hypothetical protein
MLDHGADPDPESRAPRVRLTLGLISLIGGAGCAVLGMAFTAGSTYSNLAGAPKTLSDKVDDNYKALTAQIIAGDAEMGKRVDRLEQDMAARRAAFTARLDTTERETKARFADDERDTKAAALVVNSVDLRLTRMEAQLDLVVKNITAGGRGR